MQKPLGQAIDWHRYPDPPAVASGAVERILAAAKAAIEARGCFRIVLAGGSTPERAYRLLAAAQVDCSRWHLYLGDERCLPADHPDRNSVMISRSWPGLGEVPASQQHWIPAEEGPEQGALLYESVVRDALPFDLVLLGMGEDGHTASLFPGHRHDPERLVVPVSGAPKPPPERISLNYGTLSATRALLFMITGEGKREALRRWRAGEALPVARLQCEAGIDVLLDEAAWP